jgi:hypothetical protein
VLLQGRELFISNMVTQLPHWQRVHIESIRDRLLPFNGKNIDPVPALRTELHNAIETPLQATIRPIGEQVKGDS